MTAALVAALLVLAGAYGQVMWKASVPKKAASAPGRHRLSPKHPGYETAPDELKEMLRAQRAG